MLGGRFLQAIVYAIKKKVKLPDWFYKNLERNAKAESVGITGLAQAEQVKFIMAQLQKVLDDDGNLDDFKKQVADNKLDIRLPQHRLDNIYRTNIQMAYAYGRWEQQQANKKNKPYLKYSAVNDNRTRPSHRALDGTVLPIDDPFWNTHYAPLDYRCRCHVVAITAEQAKEIGITEKPPIFERESDFVFNVKEYGRRADRLVADLPNLNEIKVVQNERTKTAWGKVKDRFKKAVEWVKIAKIMVESG